jgi:membrane glycosyltransferase
MVDQTLRDDVVPAAPIGLPTRRRALFFTLVGASIAGLIWLAAIALSPRGFDAIDLVLVVLFAVTLPWLVIGFWNATIGLLIMRFARDPVAFVTPAAARVRGHEPITSSTAILVCVRNEPPDHIVRHLTPLLDGLVAAGAGDRFHAYILSDTDAPTVATTEEACFGALANSLHGHLAVTYRRRTQNTGFKAGNIGDFCARWGARHEFAVVLDADSLMTADAVMRLIRMMQADPQLGILQSLVIGLPSTSAFARVFQFGMRLAMRSYTIGSAWWQADCGPYWGHNAAIRLKPFMAHCELPTLTGRALVKGHVLSHDQIEAVLMRRAGYEVRVLAEEGSSFEQNPPTLIEFIGRDLRWCQGNMQYWHFLLLPGLKPVSRYQLVFALLMFLGSPAWMGLLMIGTLAIASTGSAAAFIRPDAGFALFTIVLVLWFAPKIATVIDVLTRPPLRRAFGGGLPFLAGVIMETVFFLLLSPIMWFAHTSFLVRLLLGKSLGWNVQTRDDHAVPFALAFQQLWPHTLLGLATVIILGFTVPAAIPYALFVAGGPLLSIPLAVITARPGVGRFMVRYGLGRLPEETAPPPEMRALALPAVTLAAIDRAA